MQINISSSFRQQAAKAIASIVFFVIVYLILIALSVMLVVACAYAGIMVIAFKPSFITFVIGGGLMCLGLLTLFFVIKFIFKKSSKDLSGYIEITRNEEPALFALIDDIVTQTGTRFPKKVYISGDVNASVFYNSGFWSMFLPVRKNLHIGLGLMNTTTVDEFRAIIAHEFGHFSQRSMKVGSYVYNVNYVLHNMLYDDMAYDKLATKMAELNNYFSFFVAAGYKITTGIKWVLARVYTVVNINYLALSREMEFHADEVAANVAGAGPVASSLMRAELAQESLQRVLNHYQGKSEQNITTLTVFPLQGFVMHSMAGVYDLAFENGLPVVTTELGSKFNKSKLHFKDQWASHPENKDRIARLMELGLAEKQSNNSPAFSLLSENTTLPQRATALLLSSFGYTNNTVAEKEEEFYSEYVETLQKSALPTKYNNYFDNNDLDFTESGTTTPSYLNSEEALFSQQNVDRIYEKIALENDIETLQHLANGLIAQKTFDYDGVRYTKKDALPLIKQLEAKLHEIKLKIDAHNRAIFMFYSKIANESEAKEPFAEKYEAYMSYKKLCNHFETVTNDIYGMLHFISQNMQYDAITRNMLNVYEKEKEFKEAIRSHLALAPATAYLSSDSHGIFSDYVSTDRVYFENSVYNDTALELLFKSIYGFVSESNHFLFLLKKDFLDLQASLTEKQYS